MAAEVRPMRSLVKTILAAVWTAALILIVVVAVDGQEATRYDHQMREDVRTEVDMVRTDLGKAVDVRVDLAERLAGLVDSSESRPEERFQSFAATLASSQHGVRSLRLVPLDGEAMVYPATNDGSAMDAAGLVHTTDPRLVGPFDLSSGARALVVVEPVYRTTSGEEGDQTRFWGTAMVEVYLEPILGEAKLSGWPGGAVFALRGADGLGQSGAAFYGDAALFEAPAISSMISFAGGQWQLVGEPAAGWDQESPAAIWIRLGGGVLALLGSVLVGVLVSEPVRLRTAVESATRSAQESEARFRSVSDSAQDAIVTVDAAGRVLYANAATEVLYGIRREELLEHPMKEVLPVEAALVERSGSADEGGARIPMQVDSKRRDGSVVSVELSTACWELGGTRYKSAIIRDVTERRRVQESQARLATVLDTTPDFVAIADPHGRLEYVNRAARQAFGMEPDVGDRGLVDLFPENIRRGFWEDALPVALRDGTWRGESELLGAAGRRIPVSQVLLAHHDDKGHVTAVALVARDMTAEKRAQVELQDEKERFRTLSDAALEGIVIHEEGRILEVNHAFSRMTGEDAEGLVGKHVVDLVAPASRGMVMKRLRIPDGSPYEVKMIRVDGSPLTVEVAAKHFPYQDRIVQVTAVRDITERKRAEAAQKVALERLSEIERLKEIDQFKTQLLNTASHELNTPITPIRLQLHLLKNSRLGGLSDKHRKAVDVLDRNVERLAILVQDVLDVARLQSGRLKVYREPLEVETLVHEAAEAFEEPSKQAKVQFENEIHSDLWVIGDGHRLTQVLFNLLSNALKFTPEHGRIRITARHESGRAVIRVTDTGSGLTQQQMKRLFRPFSQVHDTMQNTRAGTGLGLYISKGIIEEHDGAIFCDSDGPGRGSTFGFSIPLATEADLEATQQGDPERMDLFDAALDQVEASSGARVGEQGTTRQQSRPAGADAPGDLE